MPMIIILRIKTLIAPLSVITQQLRFVPRCHHSDVSRFDIPIYTVYFPAPESGSRMEDFHCVGRLNHDWLFGHPFFPLSGYPSRLSALEIYYSVFRSFAAAF
jgi:hypothetical protein